MTHKAAGPLTHAEAVDLCVGSLMVLINEAVRGKDFARAAILVALAKSVHALGETATTDTPPKKARRPFTSADIGVGVSFKDDRGILKIGRITNIGDEVAEVQVEGEYFRIPHELLTRGAYAMQWIPASDG